MPFSLTKIEFTNPFSPVCISKMHRFSRICILSFYTTEEQLYELFGKCGDVKRIVMGLDKFKRTPCGFCFVEYYAREDAENALRYINGTRLDDRIIRTDWDAGFIEGRQFGRGKSGGQVRCIWGQNFFHLPVSSVYKSFKKSVPKSVKKSVQEIYQKSFIKYVQKICPKNLSKKYIHMHTI